MTPAFPRRARQPAFLGRRSASSRVSGRPRSAQTSSGASRSAFLVMLAVWNRYDPRIEEAARDLGANATTTFREVTLPLVWTGIFGSFLFGFTLTWNDFDRTILLQNGYRGAAATDPHRHWPQPARSGLISTRSAPARRRSRSFSSSSCCLAVTLRLRFRAAPVQRTEEEFGETSEAGRGAQAHGRVDALLRARSSQTWAVCVARRGLWPSHS